MIDVIITKAELSRALSAATACVGRDNKSAPIIRCLLIEAADGQVMITGTDMSQSCTATASAKVRGEGACCVTADPMDRFVKGLPSGAEIALQVLMGGLRITSGRAKCSLPALPEVGFPRLAMGKEDATLTMSGSALSDILDMAGPAANRTDISRAEMMGVCLELGEGCITAVATDGGRLHTSRAPAAWAGAPVRPMLPSATATMIAKMAGEAGEISLRLSDRMVEATVDGAVYTSTLLNGSVPEHWRRIVPGEFGYTATLERADFLDAMKRIEAGLSSERPSVVIVARSGELEVIGYDPMDGRRVRDAVPAETTGDRRKIAPLNGQKIAKALAVFSDERVTVSITADDAPVVKIVISGDDPNTFALVAGYEIATAADHAAVDGERLGVAA